MTLAAGAGRRAVPEMRVASFCKNSTRFVGKSCAKKLVTLYLESLESPDLVLLRVRVVSSRWDLSLDFPRRS